MPREYKFSISGESSRENFLDENDSELTEPLRREHRRRSQVRVLVQDATLLMAGRKRREGGRREEAVRKERKRKATDILKFVSLESLWQCADTRRQRRRQSVSGVIFEMNAIFRKRDSLRSQIKCCESQTDANTRILFAIRETDFLSHLR